MAPSPASMPVLKDLTADNITENAIRINSQGPDARLTYVLERLIRHLHDFARETRLSTGEWMKAIDFLTEVGQTCSPVRQEFILLSDVLGLSMLVDSIDHPKPVNSTEGSVLGPFHSEDAEEMTHGDSMSSDQQGEPCLILCTIKDIRGNPLSDVKIDIWETDSSGHYDVQYMDGERDGRCVMRSDVDGNFWFKAIKPVPYPIPHDGPVGDLLVKLRRHAYRPAHVHFMFEKPGYDHLITALFLRGDPYETSDAVFGVKESLLVDFYPADRLAAKEYGVKPGSPVLEHDFVLVTEKEASDLRETESRKALNGRNVKFVRGLPIFDID